MPQLSSAIAERARKNQTVILQALADVSQTRVADLMGTSETTVSRLKSKDLDEIAAFVAACGLKCVPCAMQCFSPDKVQALLTLAKDHLASIERPDQLTWE
jgi:hypothetical protein